MASKFMVNAAFKARLLSDFSGGGVVSVLRWMIPPVFLFYLGCELIHIHKEILSAEYPIPLLPATPSTRPSHQRTVLFGTVNKLECPIPGRLLLPPILSSRSYSDSASTPPLPKTSGSTESSQSSGPEDKTYLDSTLTPPFPKSSGSTEGSQPSGPEVGLPGLGFEPKAARPTVRVRWKGRRKQPPEALFLPPFHRYCRGEE